jgi:hypothetical protein
MNEKDSQEIAYRRLACKLFEKGKTVAAILARIPRSRSWLFKWKQRFARDGARALDSLPKTPRTSSQQHAPTTVKLVLRIRQRLEKSIAGLVCARAIRQEILRLRLMKTPPSLATINRWLKKAGLTGAVTEPAEAAYYPKLQRTQDLVIVACDWVARYLKGGEKVFAFHTLDWRSQALAQTLHTDKTAASAYEHLLHAFSQLGLPDFLHLDNDAAFTGLGRNKAVFGQILRLALYLGIEVIFIPPGEPKRNHLVERVNEIWAQSFWDKNHFSSRKDLLRKSPKFLAWYETYAPPALQGLTVKQAAGLQPRIPLLRRQVARIPKKLPLTAGRIHFLRKVNAQGEISILKEPWKVSKSLAGEYVWATLDLSQKALLIYHRHSLRAQPRLLKRCAYQLNEPLQDLLPEYKRRARRVDILKRI